jgi:four helix bundle protein
MDASERPKRVGDDLLRRLIEFAARIGKVVDELPDTRLGRHIAGQLVRCGTAGAPNYAEARGAESKRDFIHKLGVCLKELRETQCWLMMILLAEWLPESRLADLLDENDQLIAIFVSSISTAKGRKQAR